MTKAIPPSTLNNSQTQDLGRGGITMMNICGIEGPTPLQQAFEMPQLWLKTGHNMWSIQMEQLIAMLTEQTQKAREQFAKNFEGAMEINTETMSACVESANMYAKGVESLQKTILACAQANLETYMATSKAMLGVKTYKDLVEVQSDYVRTGLDQIVTDTSKVAESTLKVTSEAMAPINEAVTTAFEKISNTQEEAA